MISLKLTLTAEYALRAMSYLALQPKGERVSVDILSKGTQVPTSYLSKVMRQLVNSKLVSAIKGHGGGFCLAHEPRVITYRKILQAVGYENPKATCVFGWGKCQDSKPCPMHESWKNLNHLFGKWCEDTSLETIIRNRRFIK